MAGGRVAYPWAIGELSVLHMNLILQYLYVRRRRRERAVTRERMTVVEGCVKLLSISLLFSGTD
jgi:hypothetical protein